MASVLLERAQLQHQSAEIAELDCGCRTLLRARCAGLKQLESADNRAETVKALQWYEQQLRNRCTLGPWFHWVAVLRGYIQGYQTVFSHSSAELAPAACHQQGGMGALDRLAPLLPTCCCTCGGHTDTHTSICYIVVPMQRSALDAITVRQ
jgi:hypothetical protein